jgi:hypothetical protein
MVNFRSPGRLTELYIGARARVPLQFAICADTRLRRARRGPRGPPAAAPPTVHGACVPRAGLVAASPAPPRVKLKAPCARAAGRPRAGWRGGAGSSAGRPCIRDRDRVLRARSCRVWLSGTPGCALVTATARGCVPTWRVWWPVRCPVFTFQPAKTTRRKHCIFSYSNYQLGISMINH